MHHDTTAAPAVTSAAPDDAAGLRAETGRPGSRGPPPGHVRAGAAPALHEQRRRAGQEHRAEGQRVHHDLAEFKLEETTARPWDGGPARGHGGRAGPVGGRAEADTRREKGAPTEDASAQQADGRRPCRGPRQLRRVDGIRRMKQRPRRRTRWWSPRAAAAPADAAAEPANARLLQRSRRPRQGWRRPARKGTRRGLAFACTSRPRRSFSGRSERPAARWPRRRARRPRRTRRLPAGRGVDRSCGTAGALA